MKEKKEKIINKICTGKRKKREEGAIVVEATLSLTFFMFMIVMLLSIVNICMAKAKIGTALNETAKEISQYSYLYGLTGINDIQAENYEQTEGDRANIQQVVDSVTNAADAMKDLADSPYENAETSWDTLMESKEGMEEVATEIATSENKAQYVYGILKIGGKIYSIDNASGNFKPDSSCMTSVQNAFEKLPSNVFHKDFQGYSTVGD